jgi:hypothetical protein
MEHFVEAKSVADVDHQQRVRVRLLEKTALEPEQRQPARGAPIAARIGGCARHGGAHHEGFSEKTRSKSSRNSINLEASFGVVGTPGTKRRPVAMSASNTPLW